MRLLHRWIAPFAILFLTVISATGIYIQANALWNSYHQEPRVAPQALPAGDIPRWIDTTLAAAARAQPKYGIAALSMTMDGDKPRADVVWIAADAPMRSIDPQTGTLFQPAGGEVQVSLAQTLRRLMLQLHRGDILGSAGRWLGLACGIALFILGISGITMYLNLYRRRIRLKRWSPWW